MQIVKVASVREQLNMTIEKLSPNDGDILVIRMKRHYSSARIEMMAEWLKQKFNERDVTIMFIDDELDIELFSEEDMEKIGWIRKRRDGVGGIESLGL